MWIHVATLGVLAACPGPSRTAPELAASGPRLPEPRAIDPSTRGAAYLTALAAQIQPAWAQFLEDCRLRLPKPHPLNQPSLLAIADLWIARDGRVVVRIATGSGNGDFDTAVFDVASDAGPFPAPPAELISDDDAAHVRWSFARDARQAGPATASIVDVKLPLIAVVDRLIEAKVLDRAIARVAAAPADPERLAATERVMIAVLREGLYSANGSARRSAVEAVARANIGALAPEIHAMAGPIPDLDLRIAAIAASAQLRDPAVARTLVTDLGEDLANRPRIALAKIDALVALGRGALAAPAISTVLAGAPTPPALLALARVPDAEATAKVPGWMRSGDAKTRAAICAALPGVAPDRANALILVGLRDRDASVRATCADAAVRGPKLSLDPAVAKRLRELARDRDRTTRARAIAALGIAEPAHKLRAITDPAPEIRLASIAGAGEADLRTLAGDADPDVRAAALSALGDRAPDLATKAVTDLSAAVRRTAIATLADDAALERLANDASPDVATAAVVRLAARRGRASITSPMLATLQIAPAGSPVRVRIALAWLLAR
jgi:HEAT repeat protein